MPDEGRLSLLPPALAASLRTAPAAVLRIFAVRCARLAITETALDEPEVHEALAVAEWLSSGGDATSDRAAQARRMIDAVVRRLDEIGFKIHRRAEEEDRFGTAEFQTEYAAAFNRARAANAVATSLLPEPLAAAGETAYEMAEGIGVEMNRLIALSEECGCAPGSGE